MRITTKGRYGVRAMVNLATLGSDDPVSIRSIAEKENLSPEFLEQIFYKLKKAGLINSCRGAGGGFRINKPLETISILDILDAVGEETDLTPCSEEDYICPNRKVCPCMELWTGGTELIRNYFEKISIKDLIKK